MTDHPEKFDLQSQDIAEAKRQELFRLFPEVHTKGGMIDFERLKLAGQGRLLQDHPGPEPWHPAPLPGGERQL